MCSTLCACLLGLPTLAVAQAQANTAAEVAPPRPAAITVVSDDNYPPYILRDARDRLQGILVDSWALWEKRAGVRVDLRAMDWAKAQQTLLAGKADVIDTIFATEARRALYEFTQPYARLDVPIFFHESLSGIVNADSMNGFTIERASRAKTEFLSRMSHELRTPLNAILGFSQLLELDRTLPDRPQRFVKEILGAGEHLLALINEVLDLAQVEAGRITLSPELLSVVEIGKEVLTLMQPLAEQRQVVLPANLDATHWVRADRTRLKQVLVNLVSNAIKYKVVGGTVSLESTVQDDQTLRIGVHDTGTGIPPERLPHAFEAFNRLGVEGGAIEGTGIGLSICRRLVELMGGKISVHSRLGEGSEFRVELPRAQVTEVAQPSVHRPASTPDGPSQQAAGRRLLYVEDNPANVRLMQGIVGRHAHLHLFTAPTAALGIEMARTQRPDLLLLDINLPDMDGHTLLGVLRADPATRDIPAVAVKAIAMADDRTRARHAGFNEYLAKPIDLPRFEAMLERLLGDAASRN